MNQESIFRFVGSAGLGGGFAAGSRLPVEKGNLEEFKIIRISAIKEESIDGLVSRIIKKIGGIPAKGLEARTRQLETLIAKFTSKGKMVLLIITKAHLLHQRTLHNLKGIHEIETKECIYPGFVLLGDIDKIQDLMKKEKSLLLRTIIIPG